MKLDLHAISRDKLFDAKAVYDNGKVTVLKGSRINIRYSNNFKPSDLIKSLLADATLVNSDGTITRDVVFDSLSTAATFVAGRISNGMITWKTPDNRYVRYTLKCDK